MTRVRFDYSLLALSLKNEKHLNAKHLGAVVIVVGCGWVLAELLESDSLHDKSPIRYITRVRFVP